VPLALQNVLDHLWVQRRAHRWNEKTTRESTGGRASKTRGKRVPPAANLLVAEPHERDQN